MIDALRALDGMSPSELPKEMAASGISGDSIEAISALILRSKTASPHWNQQAETAKPQSTSTGLKPVVFYFIPKKNDVGRPEDALESNQFGWQIYTADICRIFSSISCDIPGCLQCLENIFFS
jgi:hypothetical protein